MTAPEVGSVWLTDAGYVKVVAVRDGWAWVYRCTVNGHRVGKAPSMQTNLGWFREWGPA